MYCAAAFFVVSVVAFLVWAEPKDKTCGKIVIAGAIGAVSLWVPWTIFWLLFVAPALRP